MQKEMNFERKRWLLNRIRFRIQRENGAETRKDKATAKERSREEILQIIGLLHFYGLDLVKPQGKDLATRGKRISALKALRKILQSIPER